MVAQATTAHPPKGLTMTANVSRLHPLPERAATPSSPWDFFSDFNRQQLAVATQGACAVFRGSQAMRHIQEQAAHQALMQHERAAQKLSNSQERADLMAIQSELMRFDMSSAAQYWQQLCQAALKTQAEMLVCVTQMWGAPQDNGFKTWMSQWQAAVAASLNGPAAWPAQSQ
jgi:Phasin protein